MKEWCKPSRCTNARIEGRIAIGALRRRFPHLSLAADGLEWHDSLVLRGVKSLPVAAAP